MDVTVIGGGVAGSALAIHLARRGKRVLLLDRDRFPRDKPCGEGILPHGVRELDALGLRDEVAAKGRPILGIRYHLRDVSVESRFTSCSGIAIRRILLDEIFFRHAAATPGVEAREGADVRSLDDLPGVKVLACGPAAAKLAPVAPRARRPRFGARTHLRGTDLAADFVEVFLQERGEVYTAPSAEGAHLVAALSDDPAALDGLLDRPGERVTPVLRAGPLGAEATRRRGDGWIVAGDSCYSPDPITGEGISLALLCARLMAEAWDRGIAAADAARMDAVRTARKMSRLALTLVDRKERAVKAIARRPELLGKLLAILCQEAPWSSMTWRDWWALR